MRKKKILGLLVGMTVVSNMAFSVVAEAAPTVNDNKIVAKQLVDKPIIAGATASVEQMQAWARSKGATETFVNLAPIYIRLVGNHGGVNPVMAYAQSALETGFGKFGGVINESYKNPCGLKTSGGGGDKDANAHQRFDSWEDGVSAHLDHLALYAGVSGYPRANTKDPRHFASILGKAPTVNGLSKTWATDPVYSEKILRLMNEIENTNKPSGGGNSNSGNGNTSNGGNSNSGGNNSTVTGEKQGKVTASSLNVRSGAGTNHKVIGSVNKGATVTIVESSNGWHKIKYGSNYGYVSGDYIQIITSSSNNNNNNNSNSGTSSKTGKVTASALNVRSGAGTNYKTIGSLSKGATVTIVESSNGWHKINYGSGTGYVSAEYISVSGGGNNSSSSGTKKTVAASALNVRSGAGTNFSVIGSLKNGAVVETLGYVNGWYKIKYGSRDGYVSGEYLR